MTHLTNPMNPGDPYEKCAIQFQLPNAIIWQIKFILSSVSSKKSVTSASAEFSTLAESFGKDFDKYLLKELMEQIELKDASKASKDKTESVKIQLLNQELTRASLKPEFLSYFSEIMQATYGTEPTKTKPQEFLQEIIKRLKLNSQSAIMVTLSMLESTDDESVFDEVLKIFRQKLIEFHINGKPEQLPEYAVHRILFLFDTVRELAQDPQLKEPKSFIIETNANRYSQFTPLRSSLHQDISQVNAHFDLPSYNILKDGFGLEHLEFVNQVLQPWEVLIDIGHNASYMYDFLYKTLFEFKGIDEKVMAQTILQLAIHHQGKDDHISKIVYNTFESNKDGNPASIKKEPEDKKTLMSWSIENLARAFRELYSNLNWNKVFENFGEIEDCDIPEAVLESGLDSKQFQMLMGIFNKSKPQNVTLPLQNLLSQQWSSASLQLTFIQNCISQYVSKKEKSIYFSKLKNRTATISELQEVKERAESPEFIEVWQSVDLVERLIILSEQPGLFVKVRKVFEKPIKQLPEYLLLSISLAKPSCGNIMLDEILSILMPLFLGNHTNSSVVLQKLFESNQSLFIRGICELCKHDQRMMNLSRVLDITQEVRDSLIPIVYCEDYTFALNLGILAGKRDFLHYDVWIKSRIREVGSPFINALIKYIQDHIINPVSDFVNRSQQMAETNPENFEAQKNAILDRSHLTKEKLILTIENLQNPALRQNEKIHRDTHAKITELVTKNQELFPQHYEPGQNSEEIDAAANEHFQRVFSAEDNEVDEQIEKLIQTMQQFKESQVVKEQEIYACMLHGLFDEYRFLHRYPQQYLTKIAKLFGAIIKNNLLDRVLQDIALKFVIEAFRRDGRRQKFGIIVIRSFFNMLPQFPKFLEDIYQIRQSVANSEPQMMADIERLYQEMLQADSASAQADGQRGQWLNFNGRNANQARSEADAEQLTNDSSEGVQNIAAHSEVQIAVQIEAEENKQSSESNILSSRSSQSNDLNSSKGDKTLLDSKSMGQATKDGNNKTPRNQRGGNLQQPSNSSGQPVKNNQKNQRNNNQQNQANQSSGQQQVNAQQLSQQQVNKSVTPPLQTKEFIQAGRTNAGGPQTLTVPSRGPNNQRNSPSPSSLGAKVFIPTGQKGNQPQPSQLVDHVGGSKLQQQPFGVSMQKANQQPGGTNPGGGSLNVRSAEFQRPTSTSNMGPSGTPQINIHSKEFMPSRQTQEQMQQQNNRNRIAQHQIAELLEHQKVIADKIRKAQENGTKVRLDDLLEDPTIKVESEDVEDSIRKICNNTGRGNFKQKIEVLKELVIKKAPKVVDGKEVDDDKSANADMHLRWFIHYLLTKRVGPQSVALQTIYVEMIRELNIAIQQVKKSSSVVGLTLLAAALIFKKCMVVDEEQFVQVSNVPQGAALVIKNYLQSLGSFIGALTVAKNEPVRSLHLDLKQILVEGFQVKNRKLAVTFVCRILKESQHSRVFNLRNPWMSTLLSILREMHNLSQINQPGQPSSTEYLPEIDLLFKALNVQNPALIKPHGILENLQNPNSFLNQEIRRELDFFHKKVKLVLPNQVAAAPAQLSGGAQEEARPRSGSTMLPTAPGVDSRALHTHNVPSLAQLRSGSNLQPGSNHYSESDMLRQQMSQISQRVSVSGDMIQFFHKFQGFNERKVRKLVGNAVDNSIVEILPPVVDRSVTIALITTRELVLKDFAYDGDYERVLEAADLIVQHLAGSLALVTCREPLRMSLTTNLKKIFDQHFRSELGLEVISNINSGAAPGADQSQNEPQGTPGANLTENLQNNIDSAASHPRLDTNGFQISLKEDEITEIAYLASRENLELGCKLIKKEVIEKALKKVREDLHITQAIERRKRSQELGIRLFRDESIVAQFQELPAQLQPNQNGLTQAQFQVYQDFQRLGQPQRDPDTAGQPGQNPNLPGQRNPGSQGEAGGAGLAPSPQPPFMQPQQPQTLTSILILIDQQGFTDANKGHLIRKISQMNQSSPTDEEREKLWTYVQRNLETACKNYDSRNPQAVEVIIEVLSLIVTRYTAENLSAKLVTNVYLQLDVRIFNDVELAILLMSKGIISISEWDSQLAIFFKDTAAQLPEIELQFFAKFLKTSIVEKEILTKEEVPQLISVIESMSHDRKIGKFCQQILMTIGGDSNHSNLKEFFIKWVVMSYVDDKENQERQINTLFTGLRGMGIHSFCKVMVRTSIEKALFYGDESAGKRPEKRPDDRLDFRYIDSFVKLIVVLLTMFSFNKHEFMAKVLEFIGEVVDEEHRTKKTEFNQRPFYRMLMNILTAINHSDCFNQKTQLSILFSMSDLFKNLNPNHYPGFAFSWLELISHRQFLPHFLRAQPSGQGSSSIGAGVVPGQQQFPNLPGLQSLNAVSQPDNTLAAQKRLKMKDLVVNAFVFLKNNMIPGQAVPPAIQAFYHATLRVVSVIKQDFPDFLSDFHFDFVNSLPEHCIQLRNLILYAYPANLQQPDPFQRDLKIDLLSEIRQNPRILSDYGSCLLAMGLREDLENFTRTHRYNNKKQDSQQDERNQQLLVEICRKMEQSEEVVNDRRRINSKVISAVVLFIAQQSCQQDPGVERHRESMDTFTQIVQTLNDSTRLCFLNAIVNELRFPNNHTFYFSCIILYIYAEAKHADAGREIIQQQISQIFLERLQTCGPYPWGLMISFRELIQNPKFAFMRKQYIREHPQSIANLFQGRLRNFLDFVQKGGFPVPLSTDVDQKQKV